MSSLAVLSETQHHQQRLGCDSFFQRSESDTLHHISQSLSIVSSARDLHCDHSLKMTTSVDS